jgi:hypothetical protein
VVRIKIQCLNLKCEANIVLAFMVAIYAIYISDRFIYVYIIVMLNNNHVGVTDANIFLPKVLKNWLHALYYLYY